MSNCHRILINVFLFFFSIILSSCTGIATAQPITQTPQPSSQFTAEIKTPTKIPVTLEPSPTYTSTEKPTVDQLAEASTETAQIMLAEESRKTLIATFSITCGDFNNNDTSFSPKGNWLAISCGYTSNQTLQIYGKTGKKWVLSFKDYIAKQDLINGEPMGSLHPVHWTNDEKFLYFAPQIGYDGGGTCFYGFGAQGLFRFSTEDGAISAVLPLVSAPGDGYFFAFSPQGRWLAYNRDIPIIQDLQSGEEIPISNGKYFIGDLTWSPDSQNLAYSFCQLVNGKSIINQSGIKIFSLQTHETITILVSDRELLRVETSDKNRLKIYKDDNGFGEPDYTYFDWSGNKPTESPEEKMTEQASAPMETQIASELSLCDNIYNPESLSPRENWRAVSCGPENDRTLQISGKNGSQWILSFKDYVAKQDIKNGNIPNGSLYPEHWTSDEKYLYFISDIAYDGGGTCFYGWRGQGLYRLNMDNGSVSAVLPPLSGFNGYELAFSPKDRWLAYNKKVPVVRNLQTGEEIILQEGKKSIGDFVWSPDGLNLAYSTCQPSEDYSTIKKSSIRIFSFKTHESKTVLEIDSGFLRIESGDGNGLKIYDTITNQPDYQYFDWSAEKMITPNLTPTP